MYSRLLPPYPLFHVAAPEHAEVIFLTPELSQLKEGGVSRVSRVNALPRRPPGKFYFVHKVSRGLGGAPEDDCGRLWPLERPFPPARRPDGAPLSDFCALLFRPDVIFGDIDLGEHDLDDDSIGNRLLGITLPSGGWTDKHRFVGDVLQRFNPLAPPPSLLVWFRGKCHGGVRSKCRFSPERCEPSELANAQRHGGKVSRARHELSLAFNGTHGLRDSRFADVRIDWVGHMGECPGPGEQEVGPGIMKQAAAAEFKAASAEAAAALAAAAPVTTDGAAHGAVGEEEYFATMADAWFSFCPHGDQRWNLRFLELLSAGVGPVVVADGLGLPFSQLIEWDQVSVTLGEAVVDSRDPDAILAPLRAIAAGVDPAAVPASAPAAAASAAAATSSAPGANPGPAAAWPSRGAAHVAVVATAAEFGGGWDGAGSRLLRRRAALGVLVFDTYFADPSRRVAGLLASVGAARTEGVARAAARGAWEAAHAAEYPDLRPQPPAPQPPGPVAPAAAAAGTSLATFTASATTAAPDASSAAAIAAAAPPAPPAPPPLPLGQGRAAEASDHRVSVPAAAGVAAAVPGGSVEDAAAEMGRLEARLAELRAVRAGMAARAG